MQTGPDGNIFLSTLPATRRDRLVAGIVVAVSVALFVCALPFAKTPLPPFPAFVAGYQSALAVNDAITAILLLSQFAVQRWRGMLWLACGYLFTAAIAMVHALTFPGLFGPTGWLPAGPQTTVWVYMIWHAAFPLCVIGYALCKRDTHNDVRRATATGQILVGFAAVAIALAISTWIVTVQHAVLPVLLSEGRYTAAMIGVVTTVWFLNLAALAVLLHRRPRTALDIWLMVVMCAWMFDIALSAVLNVARFDLGFYLGRIYGLCAASLVLAMLLIHNVNLQARLAQLLATLRRQAASERELHSDRERLFSAVVESSNDAIITMSLDGTITAWNRAAEQLFGHTPSEAVGQHTAIILPPDRRHESDDILARISRGEKIEHLETVCLHSSGSEVQVSISVSPLRAASGEIIGASKIARDITESRRTRDELSREIEERQLVFDTSQDLILVTDPRAISSRSARASEPSWATSRPK